MGGIASAITGGPSPAEKRAKKEAAAAKAAAEAKAAADRAAAEKRAAENEKLAKEQKVAEELKAKELVAERKRRRTIGVKSSVLTSPLGVIDEDSLVDKLG
jgi:regulator of protease activity HflC (stomatin/prohibitin superfamily)